MELPRDLGWVLISSLLAAGCARAAEPAEAPQTQYSSPPPELLSNDVGELERDLDRNEQVILAQLGQAPPSGAAAEKRKAETEAAAPAAAAEAPPAEQAAPARAAPRAAPAAPPPPPSPCADACRAFGSMQRSATRICELTGSDQERCARARERVRTAETRIAQAGCSCPPRSD